MATTDPKRRAPRALGFAVIAASTLLWGPGASAAEGSHPDFSGIYFPNGFARRTPDPLPYTPAAQKLADEYAKQFTVDDDPGRFCIWPGMPRAPWGAPFSVEVMQRPQDLTIYWEGYGMYRKIYMADHHPPEPLLASAMGHSVAHWEGDTLVIETTSLKPYPYMTRLPNTSDAHILERMKLEEREQDGKKSQFLIDDITLTDPKLYTQPIQIHAEAELRPDLQVLEYTCTDTLWDEYLQQRGLTLPDLDALPDTAKSP
jgi:hypothetical protein